MSLVCFLSSFLQILTLESLPKGGTHMYRSIARQLGFAILALLMNTCSVTNKQTMPDKPVPHEREEKGNEIGPMIHIEFTGPGMTRVQPFVLPECGQPQVPATSEEPKPKKKERPKQKNTRPSYPTGQKMLALISKGGAS